MELLEKTTGQYSYYFDNHEFTLEIPLFWEQIYKGQPREALYPDYVSLLNFVKKLPKDKIVLDVGANFGIFGIPCSQLGYKVVGFEPIKDTFDLLVSNFATNNCQDYHLYSYALSNETKEMDIYVPSCPDNASLSPKAAVANMTNKNFKVERVQTTRFDDWINEHPEHQNIGFIKWDCQGAEKLVAQGSSNFLSSVKDCYLAAEFEDHLLKFDCSYEELDSLIKSFGFKQISKVGNDRIYYKN